jgi:hypothetical protein
MFVHGENLRNQPAPNGKEFPRAMQQGSGVCSSRNVDRLKGQLFFRIFKKTEGVSRPAEPKLTYEYCLQAENHQTDSISGPWN